MLVLYVQNLSDDVDIEVISMKMLSEYKAISKIYDMDLTSINKEALLGKQK